MRDYKKSILFTLKENGPYLVQWWRRDSSEYSYDKTYSFSDFLKALKELVADGTVKVYNVKFGGIDIPVYYVEGCRWNDCLESEDFHYSVRRSYVYNC
jgi:hypothetical protein